MHGPETRPLRGSPVGGAARLHQAGDAMDAISQENLFVEQIA